MKRIWILGASLVVLALGAANTTATGTTARASASCGTEHTEGGPAHIIASGVSCTTARKVIHDFANKVLLALRWDEPRERGLAC